MGTEFEDENAKEKLKAMLNRQFGIGDVSFCRSQSPHVHERTLCVFPSLQTDAEWLSLGARVTSVCATRYHSLPSPLGGICFPPQKIEN